jgi:hypothetical protein
MLPQLRAERQLDAIEAASVPHMDKAGHRDTIRRLTQQIGGEQVRARSASEALATAGIPIEYVTADGTPAGDGTGQDETEGHT